MPDYAKGVAALRTAAARNDAEDLKDLASLRALFVTCEAYATAAARHLEALSIRINELREENAQDPG